MGKIGKRPVHGLALHRLEAKLLGGDQGVGAGGQRGADQEARHDQGGRHQQSLGVSDAGRLVGRIGVGPFHEMDVEHAGFEARQAEGEFREHEHRDAHRHPWSGARKRGVVEVVVARGDLREPLLEEGRVREEVEQTRRDHDEREAQEGDHQHRGQAHDLAVALEEHRPKEHEQKHRGGNLPLEPRRHVVFVEGIGDEVGRGVGGGERLRDHEVGGGKADQHEDDELGTPALEHPLDHPDRSDSVGRLASHVAVDRQGAEERDEHEHQRRQGGERAGPLEGDRGLVAEGAEVIDAAQAHDQQPRVVAVIMVRLAQGLLLKGEAEVSATP